MKPSIPQSVRIIPGHVRSRDHGIRWWITVCALSLALTRPWAAALPARPNILIVLADDLGFSDPAGYGGEIATPHLDALAREGLRFTQFYNTARCWPSRAALLTGYYAQAVRRDTVPGVHSGGAGIRPAWAPLLPAMLRSAGYRSYHAGKWHLDGRPLDHGFDRSYRVEDHDRHFAPQRRFEDDRELPPVPPDPGYYSTTALGERLGGYLETHVSQHPGQPFFAYLAFLSPHFPLHAPAADIARVGDRYQRGWDALRQARGDRVRALGIAGHPLPPVEPALGPPYDFPEALRLLGSLEVNRPAPWISLSPAQQEFQAAKMAIHAAMIERMDAEIGQLMDRLKRLGVADDTLVLFLSDNGASAEIMVRGDGHDPTAAPGSAASFLCLGPGWSGVSNVPFRRHKTWVHEGGISTPLIAWWPRGISTKGELRHAPGHVIDLVPTVLEVAGVGGTATVSGTPAPLRPGQSLVPLFARDATSRPDVLWWAHEGNRALRKGDWKIVASGKDAAWELYDLSTDRGETRDLAGAQSERVRELSGLWQQRWDTWVRLATRDSAPSPDGVRP